MLKGEKMEKMHCYEYLSCEKHDCMMFLKEENNETPCWDTEGTLCFDDRINSHINNGHDKSFFCENCLYRQHMLDGKFPYIAK